MLLRVRVYKYDNTSAELETKSRMKYWVRVELATLVEGELKGSLFNNYYTEV